jgi:hydroxymethylbilane synthase
MAAPILVIGARGSPLSLAQTGQTRAVLAAALGVAPEDAEAALPVTPIVTTGDRIQDRRLLEVGGKGLFTKELDEALLDGRIDLAIHSMKDVPTRLPDGLVLAAVPARADVRDAWLAAGDAALGDLPAGAVVGTASLRRQAQILFARPDLKVEPLRGNVDTRLARLESGDFAATLLARAGLDRLGRSQGRAMHLLDPVAMPPAAGQGALALVARAGDERVLAIAARIDDAATRAEVAAERAFLAALDGSCRTAIGVHARLTGDRIAFIGEALTGDGTTRWRRTGEVIAADAEALGARLGAEVRAEAGTRLAEVG